MTFQRQFLTAIQLLCIALYSVLAPVLPFDWGKMKHNFMRRYKWIGNSKYQDVVATPVAHPELIRFFPAAAEVAEDTAHSPAGCCALAHEILATLDGGGGYAAFSSKERNKVRFTNSRGYGTYSFVVREGVHDDL